MVCEGTLRQAFGTLRSDVLILVLMEYGLRVLSDEFVFWRDNVLILVLME